jgi:hypothetical protein
MSIDRIGSNSPVLGSLSELALEASGDTNAAVAAMMLEHAQQKRETLGQARLAEEEFLRKREAEQVAQIREEACEAAEAARWQALGSIAAGALGIAGGASMCAAGGKPSGESTILSSSGDSMKGLFGCVAADHDMAAGNARADATAAEHRGGAAQRRLEEIHSEQSDARELMRTAMDFLKEQSKSRAEIDQAALLHRA